jgi:hypothetical protein
MKAATPSFGQKLIHASRRGAGFEISDLYLVKLVAKW